MRAPRGARRAVLMIATVLPAVPALAAEAVDDVDTGGFRYVLSAGVTYSDNAGRASAAEESETVIQAGVSAVLQHQRERYDAGLNADMQFQKHSYSAYNESLVGGLTANWRYRMFRERVMWVVEEDLGQSLIDATHAINPDNTQNLNVLSTGPDFVIPLGPRTSIDLQGRLTDVHYAKSDYGNRRLSGSLGLTRRLSEASTLSLGGTADGVSYKDLPSSSDYDVRSASLTWDTTGSRTTLNLSAGYSTLKEDTGSTGGNTYALQLSRRVSARSTVALHAGRSFGDSADALRRDRGIRGVSVGDRPAATSSDPQKSDYATLMWTVDTRRGGMTLSGDWRREGHLRDASLDRLAVGGGVTLRRTISSRFNLRWHADYSTEEFEGQSIEFYEWSTGVGMGWNFTPTVSISAEVDHLAGKGDSALGEDTRNYKENRLMVNLNWSPER